MHRTARWFWLFGAACLFVLPGPAGAQQRGGSGGPPPAPVVVARVKAVNDAPTAEFTGLIKPETRVLLAAESTGRLVRLLKKPGDRVKQGEVVAELENATLRDDLRVLEAHLGETETQLKLAELKQERNAQLFGRKLITAQQYEDGQLNLAVAQARLDSDRAQVQRLKDQIARMVVRSPIDGQVISTQPEEGQWITPTQSIYEIFSYRVYEVLVGVPGRLMRTVPDTGTVSVSVPEVGATLKGEILAVVHHVDAATGNFTLRVRVTNREGLPLSGMLARVRLPLAEAALILTVPRDAVVRRGERTHLVTVTEDNKAQIVPVQVKGNYRDDVIVAAPSLKDGMPVVVRGNERLFPGAPVRMAESPSDPEPGKL